MKYLFVVSAALILYSPLVGHSLPAKPEAGELELSKCIERSALVVVGTVVRTNSVRRSNILPNDPSTLTTDITVKIDDLIKGTANSGKKHITFTVLGGSEFSTVHNEMITFAPGHVPPYEINEKVMLFLKDNEGSTFWANWPNNGYRTYHTWYGKRPVIDDKIDLVYHATDSDDSAKFVEFPIDFAKTLAKALKEDKDSAIAIETDIKLAMRNNTDPTIVLSTTLVNRLKQRAQTIIDNVAKKEVAH